MATFVYYLVPLIKRVVRHQRGDVRAVGGYLARHYVVELEYVLYEFLFLMVYGALFAAGVHHHAYLFLAYVVVRLVGVYAHKTQHKIGGNGEQADYGPEYDGNEAQKAGYSQRYLFRLLHGDALGYKLAEYEGEI